MGSTPVLRVLYWNPGGVRLQAQPLRLLAQSQDIHIILLGETKLSPHSSFKVPNYFVYRRDELSPASGHAYRGTAALVRRDVIHEEIEHLPFDELRTTGVLVSAAGVELKLFAGYRPPGPRYSPQDISAIFDSPTPTLLAADLNAKHPDWGSRVINPVGRQLQQDAEAKDITILGPDSPTHIPTNNRHSADVLDILLTKNFPYPVQVEVLYDLDTNHLPLLITLALTAVCTVPRPQGIKTDWEAFSRALSGLDVGRLSSPEEVEQEATRLTAKLQEAREAASRPIPQRRQNARDELPTDLKRRLATKRRVRRDWARSRCPRLKTQLDRLTVEVSEAVRAWRGETWETTIDRASEHDTNLYALNRALTRTPTPTYPLLDRNGVRRFNPIDRAEILATHLEEQFSPHPVDNDAPQEILDHHAHVEESVSEFLSRPTPPLDGGYFISPMEVRKAVLRLPGRKAPGCDGITNMALRHLPRRGVAALSRLFNGILRTNHFPDHWKTGKVIVLPKPGKDRRLPASYRPITLLPTIAKLFERLLLSRICPSIVPRPEQFGFRSQHSTTLQLARVLHLLAEALNRSHSTAAVFLDVEKAFDRVWHTGLIFKLTQTDLPPALTHLVASFFRGRSFFVSVERTSSALRPAVAGVPQGSCLSPALYAHYTNDIPTLEGHLLPGERDVVLALFADDSAYFASSRSPAIAAGRMQRLLDLLPSWLDKWRIAVNVGKTAALLVSHRRSHPCKLQLRGQDIEWQSCVRYLGVDIDRSLRMNPQVNRALQQARAARAQLRPVLISRLPLRTKVRVYKTYVRSRLTYAAPAWYALLSHTNKVALQRIQNVALRMCVSAGRYVRNDVIARDTGTESIESFVKLSARRMFDKADNGHHAHLNDLAPLHTRPPDFDKPWRPLPRDLLEATDC